MSKPLLNTLPTVIDGPGDYKTRGGGRATIHEVKPNGDDTTTSFDAKGSIWGMFRGRFCPRGYDIWHVSGRRNAVNECPHDIVGKYAA
ncbi:hypothetical protein [Erythrobacter aureus]|uniref:Uncharacterized protein n=1 Tax=Erythrobacter aureus TaxID=2182384 RepID=A0A345YJ72_9SPHN|nr:hypothetical protein [Erythrobacter aureus]AXK43974.1 hypothetical protein DVR09_16090 [Erythrobacter aureus]